MLLILMYLPIENLYDRRFGKLEAWATSGFGSGAKRPVLERLIFDT